jgi:putative zinc finger protein
MDCAKARFLLYAYLDRDLSACEADALSRHLSGCAPCQTRSRSARGLATLLRSRVDRATAPHRLRLRLQQGESAAVRHRLPAPAFALAAVILVMILPLVADESGRPISAVSPAAILPVAAQAVSGLSAQPVSRKVTGTLVCLTCEERHEAGLCPLPHKCDQPAVCADDGQVWRLMSRDPSFARQATGQTVTVEGIAFPQSGFLRASRVGY